MGQRQNAGGPTFEGYADGKLVPIFCLGIANHHQRHIRPHRPEAYPEFVLMPEQEEER